MKKLIMVLMLLLSSVAMAHNKVVVIPMGGGDAKIEPFAPVAKASPLDSDYTISTDTVIDKVTGLEWQKSDVYRDWANASNYCQVLTLDGKDDWRLPSLTELLSIVDYNDTTSPLFNSSAFPSTHTYDRYWSATNSAASPDQMLTVSFNNGHIDYNFRTNSSDARCVRSYGVNGPMLQDNGDGTVTDLATGLIWQQGADGTESDTKPLADAQSYCDGLSLGGKADWRHNSQLFIHQVVHMLPGDYSHSRANIAFVSAIVYRHSQHPDRQEATIL